MTISTANLNSQLRYAERTLPNGNTLTANGSVAAAAGQGLYLEGGVSRTTPDGTVYRGGFVNASVEQVFASGSCNSLVVSNTTEGSQISYSGVHGDRSTTVPGRIYDAIA